MNKNEIVFSHRPKAGVSVAACSRDGHLFIAIALTNDGISRNGRMHFDKRDSFSRATARNILTGRIESMLNGSPPGFGTSFVIETPSIEARKFMSLFRKVFKPTVDESDTVLTGVATFGGVETRFRPTGKQIYETILALTSEVLSKNEIPVQ